MTQEFTQEIEEVHCDDGQTIYKIGEEPTRKGFAMNLPPVKEIGEHSPQGPGDMWFYQIRLQDDSVQRIFNMSKVIFGKPKPKLTVPDKPKIIM